MMPKSYKEGRLAKIASPTSKQDGPVHQYRLTPPHRNQLPRVNNPHILKTEEYRIVKNIVVKTLKRLRLYSMATIVVGWLLARWRSIQPWGEPAVDRRTESRIRQLKKSLPPYAGRGTSLTESAEGEGYITVCRLAAMNDSIFEIFKRSRDYRVVLEHLSKEQGQDYLDVIREQGKDLLEFLPRFKGNDRWGSPIKHSYEVGELSPTTLRYIKVLTDLKNYFGDLNGFDIVEIGGGYGGQCKIVSDVYKVRSYTIMDLDVVIPLTQKYLARLNVDNVFYRTQHGVHQVTQYDLVISNYAFSECMKGVQDDYIEKTLARSKRGYITYNHDGPSSPSSPYNKEEIVQILSKRHTVLTADDVRFAHGIAFILIWDDTKGQKRS
jgi:putative sugar O-methyltransferase